MLSWLGYLQSDGKVYLVRAWSSSTERDLKQDPEVKEIFGPFQAESYLKAEAELRRIVTAVGFKTQHNFT